VGEQWSIELAFSTEDGLPATPKQTMITEEELRLAGADKMLMAIVPWLTDRAVLDVNATLRAELVCARDPEERMACLYALDLLSAGRERLSAFDFGAWTRKRAPER